MNMDEKSPAAAGHTAPESLRRRPRASFPLLRQIFLVVLSLLVIYNVYKVRVPRERLKQTLQPLAPKRVPLEIHNIVKCPNAQVALTALVLPTIERVHDKVDFRLSILARETEEGMHCKHGPEECKAAMMELCTQDTHRDSRSLVGFLECLTNEYQRIPERAHYEACAAKNSIDLEKVDQCAARDGGAYAYELLRKSAQRTIDAGVHISGTIRLNEKVYCIRDGDNDTWLECPNGPGVDELVDAIERLYNATTEEL
ncbi:hypothetical protein INS49_012073 [Diaporthe citri]|uniref:uncharacterized protein n=1 Tax=Diaporthe citri TaxID=83186 RepID=UPI001C82553E|nr:uncharacterized protein INS49_012073 [Diaporthe citri]KAG6358556.1 hypothetical protein INS49_012073 [Diaporthe citri]